MAKQKKEEIPDWMKEEDVRAQEEVSQTGGKTRNPSADKYTNEPPVRSLKGLRFRTDYQLTFDSLVTEQKHLTGKKGPDLIEEALRLLFDKYNVDYNKP